MIGPMLGITDVITVPFGWLMTQLYHLTNNYGYALLLFALLVKLILLPATAKAKKSSMKMARISPIQKEIQEKYADDPQRMQTELQALYKAEGVSIGGSCLWSLLPLLILIPLYKLVREPIQYMLAQDVDTVTTIITTLKELAPTAFSANDFYDQMTAASLIPQYAEQIKAVLPEISEVALQGVNFDFLGIDLSIIPQWNLFSVGFTWATIGGFLLPVISAGSQLVSMLINQKMNNSVITDENGIEDPEAAKKAQAAQQTQMMMYVMPIMSLVFGFSMPGAISLYWFAQGVVSLLGDMYLTARYRKIYDAEDALKLERMQENEAREAEKERIRAERRAANPDGITANTSTKKLQQKRNQEQEAERAAAAREYAKKKGEPLPEEEKADGPLSGVADRPFCKGRAYDPNRYKTEPSTEE